MNGYVQDERYTAGAGRAGAVPLSLAQCLKQGSAGAACVSFAQRLATCMGAKAAQYLPSGHAVKHPCALILDIPVS